MKSLKMFLGLAMLIIMLLSTAPRVLAGSGPEPPTGATIGPTEVWGEVVLFCGSAPPYVASVHVKRVVDCNVEAWALVEPNWPFGCSDDPNRPLKWSLTGVKFFYDPAKPNSEIPGTPYVNKVKNWKKNVQSNGTVYSFDALFKFWQ
jgi:hypothetical protein